MRNVVAKDASCSGPDPAGCFSWRVARTLRVVPFFFLFSSLIFIIPEHHLLLGYSTAARPAFLHDRVAHLNASSDKTWAMAGRVPEKQPLLNLQAASLRAFGARSLADIGFHVYHESSVFNVLQQRLPWSQKALAYDDNDHDCTTSLCTASSPSTSTTFELRTGDLLHLPYAPSLGTPGSATQTAGYPTSPNRDYKESP